VEIIYDTIAYRKGMISMNELVKKLHSASYRIKAWQKNKKIESLFDKNDLLHARIGTAYGGFSVPVAHLNSDSICYCAGAGEDITFDIGLINRFKCKVFTIDPTPRAQKHYNLLTNHCKNNEKFHVNNTQEVYDFNTDSIEYSTFLPYGLWSSNCIMKFYAPQNPEHVSHSIVNLQKTNDYFEAECKTITSIMEMHQHKEITLLKMNIEGAEYEVIENLLNTHIYPRVLCVNFDEVHTEIDGNGGDRIYTTIKKIKEAGYSLTHISGAAMTFVYF